MSLFFIIEKFVFVRNPETRCKGVRVDTVLWILGTTVVDVAGTLESPVKILRVFVNF